MKDERIPMGLAKLFFEHHPISCAELNDAISRGADRSVYGNYKETLHCELEISAEHLSDECIQN